MLLILWAVLFPGWNNYIAYIFNHLNWKNCAFFKSWLFLQNFTCSLCCILKIVPQYMLYNIKSFNWSITFIFSIDFHWFSFCFWYLCPGSPSHTGAVIAAVILLLFLALAAVIYSRCHLNIKLWYKNSYGDYELNGETSLEIKLRCRTDIFVLTIPGCLCLNLFRWEIIWCLYLICE